MDVQTLFTTMIFESESEVTQSCPTLCGSVRIAYQAPSSMGFSRQEYWSGLQFPSPGDLPNPGIKPGYPSLEADALTSEPPGKIWYLKDWLNRKSLNSYASIWWTLVSCYSEESTCNVGLAVSIPGSERSPGEGNCNPLQYSGLGNPMDRGAWRATEHAHTHAYIYS